MTWWTKTTAVLGMAWQWVKKMHVDYPKAALVVDGVLLTLTVIVLVKAVV